MLCLRFQLVALTETDRFGERRKRRWEVNEMRQGCASGKLRKAVGEKVE